jgi:hypothetical protein
MEKKKVKEFFDTDFGPLNDDDEDGSANSIYFEGTPLPGYPNP